MTLPSFEAGSPPAEATPAAPDVSQEIFDVLGLSDDSAGRAAAIAGKEPVPPTAAPAAPESGAAVPAPAAPQPSPEPPAQPPVATEPAPAPASAAPAAPSPAPTPPPATPPAVDEAALRQASLEAQLDAMRREVEQLRANPAQPAPAGQPSAESGQPGEQPFRYNLTLPQNVQQALQSEDPAQATAAIQAIVNDLGTIVHHNVLHIVRQEIQTAIAGLSQTSAESTADNARQQAQEAYYSAFPSHKNALVLPIVQSEAQKMASEFPGLKWDQQYINALGTRVNNAIAAISGGAAQPAPTPTPTPAPPANPTPARPAPMLPSGNRGAGAVTPSGDISAEIIDVLDPF